MSLFADGLALRVGTAVLVDVEAKHAVVKLVDVKVPSALVPGPATRTVRHAGSRLDALDKGTVLRWPLGCVRVYFKDLDGAAEAAVREFAVNDVDVSEEEAIQQVLCVLCARSRTDRASMRRTGSGSRMMLFIRYNAC